MNKNFNRRKCALALLLITTLSLCAGGVLWATAAHVSAAPLPQLYSIATPVHTSTPAKPLATPSTAAPRPVQEELYNGLPAGLTAGGQAYLGDLAAPVVLHEYSDYLCPFCGRYFQETYPLLLDEYVETGQVLLIFHDFPLPSLHPTALVGHQAARCVAEQGPALFWAMHDALFARQNEWNHLPDPSAFIGALAREIGADPAGYAACMASARTVEGVDAGMADGSALGFNGTPSFRLERPADGYTHPIVGAYPMERFRAVIDAMLAGEEAQDEPAPEPPELPYWAGEGLAPDPQRPGYTLAGDPYKGSEDAALTIVEFSDFQCPACARHVQNVQPALDEQFVKTGQVRWVFKNLPLRVHPYAPAGAAAAECAGNQGQFWELHDRLFATQEQWATEEVDEQVLVLAAKLDLDLVEFESCFMGRASLERILPDVLDAQGIASTTPTFVILQGQTGTVMNGSRSTAEFAILIENFLTLQ